MSNEEEYQKAVKNQERQTECFKNVLNDRKNIDDDFDTYCEEMQEALVAEEKAAKKCGYY